MAHPDFPEPVIIREYFAGRGRTRRKIKKMETKPEHLESIGFAPKPAEMTVQMPDPLEDQTHWRVYSRSGELITEVSVDEDGERE